jgi:hypothetical protein
MGDNDEPLVTTVPTSDSVLPARQQRASGSTTSSRVRDVGLEQLFGEPIAGRVQRICNSSRCTTDVANPTAVILDRYGLRGETCNVVHQTFT